MRSKFPSRFLSLLGFVCVFFLVTGVAFAQEGEGMDPRASFSIGGSLMGGAKTFFVGPDGFNTKYQNGARIAFRGNFNIREHWGIEGNYGFESGGLQVTRTTPVQSVTDYGVHIHQVEANGLYYFDSRGHRFRPFATVGIGVLTYSPSGDAKIAAANDFLGQPTAIHGETHPDFIPGVGVEGTILPHIGVRFDLRDHITGISRFGLPENAQSPNGARYPVSGLVNNWEISGGVEYHFR